MLLMQAEAN